MVIIILSNMIIIVIIVIHVRFGLLHTRSSENSGRALPGVCHHRHHHHHHYNRHHHPRNKLADQAELFNPNGGDRFWPEHFWPMSRSSQVCRGMFLIIRNLKYFDTIQTFLIRQNWGVKKTMFTLLFYSYFQIYFLCSTHCIGFNTAHIVPFDQEISRGLQDLPQALLLGKSLVAGKSLDRLDRTSYSFSKHVSSSRQRNPLSPTCSQVAYKCRPAAFVSRQICGAATQV